MFHKKLMDTIWTRYRWGKKNEAVALILEEFENHSSKLPSIVRNLTDEESPLTVATRWFDDNGIAHCDLSVWAEEFGATIERCVYIDKKIQEHELRHPDRLH